MAEKTDEQYIAAIGIRRKGDVGFRTIGRPMDHSPDNKPRPQKPPPVEPHLIHDGTGARCSVCGSPVNIPAGTCAPCPSCGQNFGNTCG